MDKEKENLLEFIKKAIEYLAENNISDVVILSSYKIASVLKENYGVDIKIDRIGRVLSNVAKNNQLKRLQTNIPKYQLYKQKIHTLRYF
ncbi:MAG: hypothetical protein ACTSU4_05350 [Promethearchaeota archaeon]